MCENGGMDSRVLQSGGILRGLLLALAAASIVLMPSPGESSSLAGWHETLTTVIVPAIAPIIFVVLLMDVIMYSATSTGSDKTPWQKTVLALEGVAGMFILLRWLPFVLSAN